jgi:hypothetical protein
MISGKNPKNGWANMLENSGSMHFKGGGLGLYGDFLYPIILAMVEPLWRQCLARLLAG